MTREPRIALALDTPDLGRLRSLAARLGPRVGALKIGLEAFVAHGPGLLDAVAGHAPIFLDLKLHDIPNTVVGAVRALRGRGISWLTVHTLGGPEMLAAAAAAAAGEIHLLGVTVLTSMDAVQLSRVGFRAELPVVVEQLATLAHEEGLSGVVCSPHELPRLRPIFARPFVLVTPGIRPEGGDPGDQRRSATPAQAAVAGADMLVIGRPVVAAPDPEAALEEVIASLPPPAKAERR